MGDMIDEGHYESDGDEICMNCGQPWCLCKCYDEDSVDDRKECQ